ncbi:GNAT family N-acetyltransferase [Mucilaginibacter sp. UR6-1]|uniref:GNAT family N-acetyltransferase n=1 Tax=Mucilaginibacter sp. UR6-1 TaxID=1435643 RepID=UPI001E56D114|nr:GNAT family N-acetyltransferase [Mucilaginibacter sp. UR6-1]MCC8408482.1 GNAT family N-acetyltransferase [Mucilaginibacter sp. UR6-1]
MMPDKPQIQLRQLSADDVVKYTEQLGGLLHACVHNGASIGFVLPFSQTDGEGYWAARVLPAVQTGSVIMFAAIAGDELIGTVQLDIDTMPNQPHRAEVKKLMVHPGYRRQGIAKALMIAIEKVAEEHTRNLLTLDTRTGDGAEPLYISLGYQAAGIIPGYCLDPAEDRLDATTIMYKTL